MAALLSVCSLQLSARSAYEVYRTEVDRSTYRVPFEVSRVGDEGQSLLFVRGQLCGRDARFVFDTGAAYNVISPELATRYGLRLLDASQKVVGTHALGGRMAMATTLHIGDLTLHDVPFVVLDHRQGNGLAAPQMESMQLIIGQSLMLQFGAYTLDFTDSTLWLQKHGPTPATAAGLLCMTSGGVQQVRVTSGPYAYALTLDTGATTSWLGPDFYNDHRADVARRGRWDIKAGAGYGGTSYSSVFRLPEVPLAIGARTFTLKDIDVVTLSTETGTLSKGGGRLGLDFFRLWSRVTIDNLNMTISLDDKAT